MRTGKARTGKAPKFPARVWFGFNPKGQRVTNANVSRQSARIEMLFDFAARVHKRSSIHSPEDGIAAKKAGWFVQSVKLERAP